MDDGSKIAAYSVLIDIILAATKLFLALLSGSTAVFSEAVHSFTDVLAGLFVLLGIRISRVKSPKFPWGLYKTENIASIISSFFIFFMAYEIAKDVLLGETKELVKINTSLFVLAFMVVPVYLFARYEKKKAERLNSPSLAADAEHWITDILSLVVVIVGLAASRFTPYADKVAAVIVIVVVLRVGFRIFKNSMKSLLDASVDRETLERIRDVAGGFSAVQEVISLKARNSGSFIFVHMELGISTKKLKEAHRVVDDVERAIRKEVPFIEKVSIHYEPAKRDFIRFASTLSDKENNLSRHFGSAPFLVFWNKRISDGAVVSREVINNPFVELKKGKGIKLAELLVERGVEVLYTREDFKGKGPEHVLSEAEVEVKKIETKTLKDIIGLLSLP